MATRIVVEWTRTTLRLALAEGAGGRYRLKTVYAQPIGAATEVVMALRALLKTVKASGAEVISVVPREQVITRVVRFPASQPQELAQMVELYGKGQLPYPREQTVMDFHVVNQQEGFSTVAIVACQREIVERQLTVLREAGLPPSLLIVSSWGVLSWYQLVLSQGGAGSAVRPNAVREPVLVIHVDDTRSDLVLIAGGRMVSNRSIGQGVREWGSPQEVVELLMTEAERSRVAIRKELPGTEVRSLILTGLGPLREWSEPLAERLGLSVVAVESRQPFQGWTAPLAAPVSPVVIGGLACRGMQGLLNLNPPEVRVQLRHQRQVRELVLVSALLIGVLVLGSGLLALQGFRQQRETAQLAQVLMSVEPRAKQVKEKLRLAQLMQTVLKDRQRLAKTLSKVFLTTPPAITLEGLVFERSRHELVLRGNAETTQTVLDYVKQLEGLDDIERVQLKYSTRRSTPSGERTDFEMSVYQKAS
jgi:type IV pilus assembly protein PilM